MHRCCNLILFILLLAVPALALDVPALVATAPGMDQFPDDDIVVLYQSETIDVDAHLRVTRRVHTVRRLQTQWAMRRQADVRVAWDAERQELEVLTARTFMTDGDVRETPANGFNEVTPDAVARAVPFLGLREMVITHIGTEPGCVVELEYVIRDLQAAALPTGGRLWLGGDHPVLEAHATVGGHASLTRTVGATADEHAVHVQDLPAFEADAEIPHVVWSLPGDLESSLRVASDQSARVGPRLVSWLDDVRSDPTVLTSGDLMDRIATLIHDEIATVNLPTGDWSRAPRPADAVFTSGVGTAWERALVAMALVRAAGHAPELGLFVHPERPDQLPFSHLRVVGRIGDQNWWLAPDRGQAWTGNCDLGGYQGVFLSDNDEPRRYQVPIRPFACRWHVTISPSDQGWRAEADLEYDGLNHTVSDARALAEGLAGDLLVDGALADLELRESTAHSLALRLTATGEALAESAAGLVCYPWPWPDLMTLGHDLSALDRHRLERVGDLVLDTEASLTASVMLDVPAGWSLDTPTELDISRTVGPFTVEHRTTPQERGLRLDAYIALKPGRLPAAQWPELRQALLQAEALQAGPVVLITGE